MKNYISILLLIVLAVPHVLQVAVMLQWKMNQGFIAANYCENRQKPAMKCDGKCYLRKQLARVGVENPTAPIPDTQPPVKPFEYAPFLIPDTWMLHTGDIVTNNTRKAFPAVCLSYHFTFITSLFQPPDMFV